MYHQSPLQIANPSAMTSTNENDTHFNNRTVSVKILRFIQVKVISCIKDQILPYALK